MPGLNKLIMPISILNKLRNWDEKQVLKQFAHHRIIFVILLKR